MRKYLFFLILCIIIGFAFIWENIVFADQHEFSALESQQYKILKLSKITQNNPQDKLIMKNIEYYNKGLAYYNQRNYTEAISNLLEVHYSTLILPLYIKSQYLLGDCYKKNQQLEESINIYQNLIPKDLLFNDFTHFFLAQAYQLDENYELSNSILNDIILNFPESSIISRTFDMIAQNYLNLNQIDFAIDYFKKALERTNDEQRKAEILIQLSEITWQENQFLESIEYLFQIIDQGYRMKRNSEPEERLIRQFYSLKNNNEKIIVPYAIAVKAGDVLFKYRQYKQAKDVYDEIIKQFPEASDIEEIYYKRARTFYYMKEYQKTIDHCSEIITKFTSGDIIIRAKYLLSNTLLTLGETSDALRKYYDIIEQHDQSYYARQSYLRIAECYFRLKENQKAQLAWQELNDKYPNSYEAMTSLWKAARYNYANEDYISALDALSELVERFSKSNKGDDSIYWMGKTLQKLGREEEAKITFQELISNLPLSYYTEKILEENEKIDNPWLILGDYENKFVDLEDFLDNYNIVDDKSKLAMLKAELFKEISFFEESINEMEMALNNNPGNISLLFELSDIYRKNKNYTRSLYFTEIIFAYLTEKQAWNEIPLELWQHFYPDYYGDIVKDYAEKYHLEPLIVLATIREESRFNPWDESVAGARGLMQIIYSTGEWIAQKINLENFSDEMLFSPNVNIDMGCWYINYLKERFEDNLVLVISGYNAGPGTTSKWLESYDISDLDNFIENIPYDETREHVKKVIKTYQMYKRIEGFAKMAEKGE